MRRILVAALKRQGYDHIVEASSTREGMERLAAETFDLLITDWIPMEDDGLSFVRAARGFEAAKHVPILMITTKATRDHILEAVRAGVNGYIVKPFTPDTLRDKIDGLAAKPATGR
jgi:two-component system, chemotaxis family, chemotaxis protein CheY